jgi:hypothetical protein
MATQESTHAATVQAAAAALSTTSGLTIVAEKTVRTAAIHAAAGAASLAPAVFTIVAAGLGNAMAK